MLSHAFCHDVSYLTDAVGSGRENYYTDAVDVAGEPAGIWYGAGAEMLGLRGEVDADVMKAVYHQNLDPRDPAQTATLGAPRRQYRTPEELYAAALGDDPDASPEERLKLRAEAERKARQAVAFVDLTFSAPKDVTVLGVAFERMANEARAAGDARAADAWSAHHRAVEDAVMAGARASLDYAADRAGYARVGRHGGSGGRWVDAHGWVAAQFLQHDNRDHDPHLHVHQAVLNKVLRPDGTWGGLDGMAIALHRGAACSVGERVMYTHLARALGVRVESRTDGHGQQIAGVPQQVLDMFSTRTRAIGARTEQLVDQFRTQFRREPTSIERKGLAQQATLWTRKAKSHDGESAEQRLERWERETREKVAGGLREVARRALHPEQGEAARWDPQDVIERALDEVAQDGQTWTRPRLIRALSDALPAELGLEPEKIAPLLEQLADQALGEGVRVDPEQPADLPDNLRLADGRAATVRPGSERFTTEGTLLAEQILRDAAVERVDAHCTAEQVDEVFAILAKSGLALGDDQAAAVRGILTSGAQLQLLSAPAGTGKSITVGAVAEGWRRHGGRVRGLAPSQVAAQILAEDGVDALNLAAWRARLRAGEETIEPGDLLVVDEAGMATTDDLREVVEQARAAGASVVLAGDPRQLGAVGPGGALADLEERAVSYSLGEVRRFHDHWERAASLRLRDGDVSVLDEYDKHGRLLAGGTREQAEQAAERAWLADTLSKRDAVLLVGSNETAASVSGRLRAQLVRLGLVEEHGHALRDENLAGVGDLVQARRNDWSIVAQPVNRATYRVLETLGDGSLRVQASGAEPIVLPAAYVQQDLTLGYASTVHAAQGRTVDASHAVLGSNSDTAAAYVALTRGRHTNTAYVVTLSTPADEKPGIAQSVEPRPARAVLADTFDRPPPERTALAEMEAAREEHRSITTQLDHLAEWSAHATAGRFGRLWDQLAAEGVITDEQRQNIAIDRSTRALERKLRSAEVAGHDPEHVARGLLGASSLAGARSVAQVLHARISKSDLDLTPRLATAGDLVPRWGVDEADTAHLRTVAADLDTRRHELGAQLAEEPPAWLVDAIGPVPGDVIGREEWERKAGWAATSREATGHDGDRPLGVPPKAGVVERHAIWQTAHAELDLIDGGASEAQMSPGGLRRRVVAAEREAAWAPRYVHDELAAAEETLAKRRQDATLWRVHADTMAGEDQATLRDAADGAEREAQQLAEQVAQLREVDEARAVWLAETAVTRDLAERAKAELDVRGVDLGAEEHQVTAEEWLAAQQADQAADERHRPVREGDVADEVVEAERDVVEVDALPLELPDPDIRQTATVDDSEHADTGRQVPSLDQTREAVDRARAALLEVQQRDVREPDHQHPIYESDLRREDDLADTLVDW